MTCDLIAGKDVGSPARRCRPHFRLTSNSIQFGYRLFGRRGELFGCGVPGLVAGFAALEPWPAFRPVRVSAILLSGPFWATVTLIERKVPSCSLVRRIVTDHVLGAEISHNLVGNLR